MPHIRIEPLKELEFLSQRMKKFAEEFPENFSFEIGRSFEPKVDVQHDTEKVYVTVEAPGVKKEDIKVILKDDVLNVSGTKKGPEESSDMIDTRLERAFGDFSRKIALPCEVDANTIDANMSDGVLTIVIGKRQVKENREITIEIL